MLDTLRLMIPAHHFDPDDLDMLRRLQSRFTKTNWDGDVINFSLVTAVSLPSWFEGFHLQIGERVTLEGSPKTYQGHNVTGHVDLMTAARRLVDHVFGTVFGLFSWPDAADWYLSRADITYQYDFGTPEALDCWMDTVKGVQRGIRRASVDAAPPDEQIAFEGYGSSQTLYIGKRSRYKAGKIYCKGYDLRKHPPRALRGSPEAIHALAQEFVSVARFEAVIRALWFSDHAVDLGLLPEYFRDFLPGVFRENVLKYLLDVGVTPIVSSSRKEPRIYFPLWYLAPRLDLPALWSAEFSYLFSTEAAMMDSSLLSTLQSLASTPAQGRRAYAFLMLIRSVGLSDARASISKSTWYNYRRLLHSAGVSDAQIQDGVPLIRVPIEARKVLDFRPDSERLRLVELSHRTTMTQDICRLRAELKVA